MPSRFLWVALALASPTVALQEDPLIRAAHALEHLEPGTLLFDLDALPESARKCVAAASVAELEGFLAHEEGAVRTLAMTGLLRRLGPHALPLIVPLADDERPAPPRRVPMSMIAVPEPWPVEPQTVGELAREVVQRYLEAAGLYGGIEGRGDWPGFDAYWAARGARAHCLSWWRVALGHASRSTIPTPPDRLDEIAALRAEIDTLDPVDRAWTLLALATPWETGAYEPGARELASEEELVAAAGALRDRGLLLALLRGGDLGSDDPDVALRPPTAFPYARIVPFVLLHARELLAPDAVDELLRLERDERVVTAAWAIAAADLAPERARATLESALERYADGSGQDRQDLRCFLAMALWRHAGEDVTDQVLDWFFTETPARGAFGFGRCRFAAWLGEGTKEGLLRAILRDTRLKELDWQTLEELARATNEVNGQAVVGERELARASHPLGMGHYLWGEDHEEQMQELQRVLGGWCDRMTAWAE